MRVWISAYFAVAALSGCGSPDRAAVTAPTPALPLAASATPFSTYTPVISDYPTAPVIAPVPTSTTPWPTPTATPTPVPEPTVELPPTPALPLDQALGQLKGNMLLFTNRRGFLVLTDGQRELWLTADDTTCGHLGGDSEWGEWSADGRFLAITCASQSPGLAILDVQTGRSRRLNVESAEPILLRFTAGWSPTADTLLIVSGVDGKSRVSTVDAAINDGPEHVLFEMDAGDSMYLHPAWSPDGSQVAIYTGNGAHGIRGTRELFLVSADGANRRRFMPTVAGDQCGQVEWSRDARFIFIAMGKGDYCTQVAADTGAETYMVYGFGDRSPHWSPDGTKYVVKERPPDQAAGADAIAPVASIQRWSLRRANGTQIREFPDTPERELVDVAWLPDSQRLAMLARHADAKIDVIVVDKDGRQATIAAYPGYDIADRLAVAPDGTLVIGIGTYVAMNSSFRVVIMDPQGHMSAEFDGQIVGWRPQIR